MSSVINIKMNSERNRKIIGSNHAILAFLGSFLTAVIMLANDNHAFIPPSVIPRREASFRPTSGSTSGSTSISTRASTRSRSSLRLSSSSPSTHSTVPRDIVIIGGGLAGLSIAHHIARATSASSSSLRHITILEREDHQSQTRRTVAGSFAAAGMLAPQSERLPAGPLLDVCLQSREMYGDFVQAVESGARAASGEAGRFLCHEENDVGFSQGDRSATRSGERLEPWEVGFHSKGGFLAPAFAGDAVATWSPQPNSGKAYWLDDVQVRELEPSLHKDVVGGWWFPEDASVDARRLTSSLRAAVVAMGVDFKCGDEWEVTSLEMTGGKCKGIHLANGKIYAPNALIIANGSWMRHLLPLPITPHKGQSLSLRMPHTSDGSPPLLSRVLFAQDTYIVPKSDGRIIVGATVEPGRYDGDVTPEGMMHCLHEATRLIPSLSELPIEETWAGLRPTTPDKCPILGTTEQFDNVYLAGGYWRNGVLLAPKTGQLVGDLVMHHGNSSKLSKSDQQLLKAFSWERFTVEGGGKTLAANARYAATLYPVHKRSSSGVAAAVGTELGFYEGASAAKEDRAKDRQAALFGSLEEEDALERAASLGVGDAQAFSFGESRVDEEDWIMDETRTVEADPDAFTVGILGDDNDNEDVDEDEYDEIDSLESLANSDAIGKQAQHDSTSSDLTSLYEQINANKAHQRGSIEMGEQPTDDRPDFSFRIYHVDSDTRELTEVPPYTSPGEFFRLKSEGKLPPSDMAPSTGQSKEKLELLSSSSSSTINNDEENEEEEEPSFDGYQTIREAYGEGVTPEQTAEATRNARMRNRIKSSEIDESSIGAMATPGPPSSPPTSPSSATNKDLSALYGKIKSNKDEATYDFDSAVTETRPKLNFTIYHVDSQTRERTEVPQYMSPGEFLAWREQEKSNFKSESKLKSKSDSTSELSSEQKRKLDNSIENRAHNNARIDDGSDEKTYDGYQDILNANSASTRDEELRRMKEARVRNRAKASSFNLDDLP